MSASSAFRDAAKLLSLCVVLGVSPALASELPPELARAVRDYDRAQFGNDVATLDRLVVDDFVLVNSDGSVENKAQFLADFNLPGFKIEPYVVEQPVQKVWRDGAVIGGLVKLRWTQDGQHHARRLRAAYVWEKRGGRWLATYAQVTRGDGASDANVAGASTVAKTKPAYQTTEIAPGLYSFGAGLAFNAFMVTDDGVIVMDSFDADFASASFAAIRKITSKPIKYLIYSHNHYDHISGGEVFKAQGAVILSHEAAANWLKSHPSPDVVMPDETWSGSKRELKLGGSQINLLYFGPNHGEGMTVFQFPREKVIYTVDLVVPSRVGFAYMPDFSPKEWERTLAEMSKLDFGQVMFAHNAAVGPRSSVEEQLKFLQDLRAAIFAEFEKGTPFMRIPTSVKLPRYENWSGYEEWLPMNAWRVLLEIAMGV